MEDLQKVACPSCAKTLKVRPDLLGKKVRCKNCQTIFRAGEDTPTPTPAPTEPPSPTPPPVSAAPAPFQVAPPPSVSPAATPPKKRSKVLLIAIGASSLLIVAIVIAMAVWFASRTPATEKPLNDPELERRVASAKDIAAAISDPKSRERAQSAIWHIYAAGGDKAAALALHKPDSPTTHVAMLIAIARGQQPKNPAAAGKTLDEALAIAQKIDKIQSPENSTLVCNLAAAFAFADSTQGMEKALALNPNLDQNTLASFHRSLLTLHLARKQFPEAYALAAATKDAVGRQNLMIAVANAAEKAGDKDTAAKAWEQAITYPLSFGPGSQLLHLYALGRTEPIFAALQKPRVDLLESGRPYDFEKLLQPMRQAKDDTSARKLLVLLHSKIPAPQNSASAGLQLPFDFLLRIAAAQCDLGDADECKKTLTDAMAFVDADRSAAKVRSRVNPMWAPSASAAVAALMIKNGDAAAGAAVMKQAAQDAAALTEPASRAQALAAVVTQQAATGDVAAAEQTAQSLPKDAALESLQYGRTEVLRSLEHAYIALGSALWKKGDKPASAASFDKALAAASEIKDRMSGDLPAARIAAARALAGDAQGAFDTLAPVKEQINWEYLATVAAALMDAGQKDQALQVASWAHRGGLDARITVLNAIALKQFHAGNLDAAVATAPMANIDGGTASGALTLLEAAAQAGKVDLVVKNLDTGYAITVLRLAKIRLDANDAPGACRILQKGIEAAMAPYPNMTEDPWPLIDALAQDGDLKDALAAAETYKPAFDTYHPEPVGGYEKTTRPARMALLKLHTHDLAGALASAKTISDPAQRDRTLLQLFAAIESPTPDGQPIP